MKVLNDNGRIQIIGHMNISDNLDLANYAFDFDKDGMFLREIPSFSSKGKLYDNDTVFIDRVLKSYHNSIGNMGILLAGMKGQGKSITAKRICQLVKLPVILITTKLPLGLDFMSFLNGIEQDIVIFVDEFEKLFSSYENYDTEHDPYHNQSSFLSLTDGALTSKFRRLFIFTSNDSISGKFSNRPSRVRFCKEYKQMNPEIYDAIIADLLVNKDFEQDLRENITVKEANIDLLISAIKEINIQNEPLSNFIDIFNYVLEKISYNMFKLVDEKTDTYKFVKVVEMRGKLSSYNNFSIKNEGAFSWEAELEDEGVIATKYTDKNGKTIPEDDREVYKFSLKRKVYDEFTPLTNAYHNIPIKS